MIAVVTSCSLKGWQEYGKRFIETFCQHWPSEVDLYVVSEDKLPTIGREKHYPLPYRANNFLLRNDNPRAKGLVQLDGDAGWKPKKVREGYNFRYDAYRFSKKVFAIEKISHVVNLKGKLFWIDADVVTFEKVRMNFLHDLLPDKAALSCLQRGTYHSECGFVGYNLDRDECVRFIHSFAELYFSGNVFTLQEWHDSWIFDYLRKRLNVTTFSIEHKSRSHPFVNSVLGTVMDHLKGERKTTGTKQKELNINKELPYWKAQPQ
jgi:hypothetical protein